MGITYDNNREKYRIECKNTRGERVYYGLWDDFVTAEKVLNMLIRIGEIPDTRPDNRYIYYMQGKYRVLKTIDDRKAYYGGYDTLEEARKRRDYLVSIDWDEPKTFRKYERIERDDSMKYIYLDKRSGNYFIKKGDECYGTFKSLDDAKNERDYMVSIDWDYGDMY